ncbi:MAG: hypothetical protein O7B32_00905 [Thaumarchaeota archaeon]|nr:hypothetical protein [Nitrososphaerota archaeon]
MWRAYHGWPWSLCIQRWGFTAAFLAFGVYAATMAALMVFVSLLASSAKKTGVKFMRRSTARVQRITAIAQAGVGALIIFSYMLIFLIHLNTWIGLGRANQPPRIVQL